jgi:hypothetical protein
VAGSGAPRVALVTTLATAENVRGAERGLLSVCVDRKHRLGWWVLSGCHDTRDEHFRDSIGILGDAPN